MIKSLFKPKWQHKDAQVRRQALINLDPSSEKDETILVSLVVNDPDKDIRKTSLEKIRSLHVLKRLFVESNDSEIKKRSLQLLSDKLEGEERQRFFSGIYQHIDQEQGIETLISFLEEHPIKDIAEVVVSKIKDNKNALADLIIKIKIPEIQQNALQYIDDIDVLKSLQKHITQKKLTQNLREKIKVLREQEHHLIEKEKKIDAICDSLNKLAAIDFDGQYLAKLKGLELQWASIEETVISQEQKQKFQKAQELCLDKVKSHQSEQEKLASALALENNAKQLLSGLDIWCEELKQKALSTLGEFDNCFQLFDEQWQTLKSEVDLDNSVIQHFDKIKVRLLNLRAAMSNVQQLSEDPEISRILIIKEAPTDSLEVLKNKKNYLAKQLKGIHWPYQDFAKSQFLINLEGCHDTLSQFIKEKESDNKKHKEELEKSIFSLKKLIHEKKLTAANRSRSYIENKLQEVDPWVGFVLDKRLQSVDELLSELRSWHQFATTPKKEGLCERMTALIGSETEPVILAQQIQALWKEWRQLQSSNADTDNQLWEQFKSAADKAYVPCQAFYEQKDKERAHNLSKRQNICTDLETLVQTVNWDSVDWKNIIQIEKTAKLEWSQCKPVPKEEIESSQERFTAVMTVIRDHLNQERNNNLENRKELIEKAERLQQVDDIDKAISMAESLQAQWKTLGITFFKADRETWQCFKQEIDKVFQRRRDARKEEKQKLDDNVKQLEGIIQKIDTLSQLDDSKLESSYDEYNQLNQSFDFNLELPESLQKKLHKSFDAVSKKYLGQYKGLAKRKQKRAFDALIKAEQCCIELENQCVSGEKDNISETFHEGIEKINQIEHLEKNVQEICITRIKELSSFSLDELDEKQQAVLPALLEKLIQLEVMTSVETPEAFKQDRMQYQLNQLQQGAIMKTEGQNLTEQVKQWYVSWLSVGILDIKTRQALQERVLLCCQQLHW